MAVTAIALILVGCGAQNSRPVVDVSSIPNQEYLVTVSRGPSAKSYAVLLDIPDDGIEVFMRYTSRTEKVGLDWPRKTIDEFEKRVRFYRTIRIDDQGGTVRGYLILPNLVSYSIRPFDNRIEVSIGDRGSGPSER